MEKYEISKEQILELERKFYAKDSKELLKEWFPSAFKKELEVGKWYKRPHNSALFYVTEILNIDSIHCKVFGFDNSGDWMPKNARTFPDNDFEATPEEWQRAMTKELIKRYGEDWENVKLEECLWDATGKNRGVFGIEFTPTRIFNRNGCIFKDGIFAEILDDQKELKESIEKMRAELLIMEKQLK